MPELNGANGWLNSAPLSREGLQGKVVLADIWTYSCINSLRQLPYLRNWAAKYKDAGLIVIGVHSPEFDFEKDPDNVKWAVNDRMLSYPNAIDSRMAIWNAFNNEYWPADYLIDGKGRIRYHHFGEGEYDQSEKMILQLLKENGARFPDNNIGSPPGVGIEAPSSMDVESPETYAGYLRTENFGSLEEILPDEVETYTPPPSPSLNEWGLDGSWKVGGESAMLQESHGRILFRFHARDLHMVLGPTEHNKPIRYTVRLDGSPPGDDHGIDSETNGSGEVQGPRLYQLIRQRGQAMDRTFEIEFFDPGVQAYSFTFG